MDRLWLPLAEAHFFAFADGIKHYELRFAKGSYAESRVYRGRKVELSKGYGKTQRMWGTVGKVIVGSLEEVLARIPFDLILPKAKSLDDATSSIRQVLIPKEQTPKYIAFEVILD